MRIILIKSIQCNIIYDIICKFIIIKKIHAIEICRVGVTEWSHAKTLQEEYSTGYTFRSRFNQIA